MEIIDVKNVKSSPRSPRPKINWLHLKDDRHDEKHFHTITYHNSRVEPLFYDDEKHRKLLLLLHGLFLINSYGAKVITSVHVLLDYFFAGPREARDPHLDSDQRIAFYACAPRTAPH